MPDVAPYAYSTSRATRLLCVGARIDPQYANSVIEELLDRQDRFVAPAYGYDAVPVLGHALAARSLRRARIGVSIGLIALILLPFFFGPLGFTGALALCAWVAWAAAFAEQVAILHNLVQYLTVDRFDGRHPDHFALDEDLVRKITEEQDCARGVVHYGEYVPFVGAGTELRSWSFATLLHPRQGALDAITGHHVDVDRAPDPGGTHAAAFTVEELLGYVAERLSSMLKDPLAPLDQRIEGLTVERRWYCKTLTKTRPDLLDWQPPDPGGAGSRLYEAAREYLCVRVGSWDEELVTSIFVGFDVKGSTLHSELHSYVLPPINSRYHLSDRLPAHLGENLLARLAWDGFKQSILGALTAPFAAIGAVTQQLRRLRRRQSQPAELNFDRIDLVRYVREASDFGARTSIRQLASPGKFHHYFQQADAGKYTKIVERRLLESVQMFLETKDLDTGEFHQRQTTVLNIGIANTGSGTVENSGVQAIGPNPTAQGRAPARAPAARQGAGSVDGDVGRNVFVVYGRDEPVRAVMFGLLQRLDLRPLDWEDLVRGTGQSAPFVGEVVARAPAQAQAALVLLTPDDVVRLHPALHGPRDPRYETRDTCQPRPNVLLELGMVLMAYAHRTVIVEFGDLRPVSDLAGRNTIRFDGSVGAVAKLADRLKLAGCRVNDRGSDWLDTRHFAGLDAYMRAP